MEILLAEALFKSFSGGFCFWKMGFLLIGRFFPGEEISWESRPQHLIRPPSIPIYPRLESALWRAQWFVHDPSRRGFTRETQDSIMSVVREI